MLIPQKYRICAMLMIGDRVEHRDSLSELPDHLDSARDVASSLDVLCVIYCVPLLNENNDYL